MPMPFFIRPTVAEDLPVVAAFAEELVRLHHLLDPERFFLPEGVKSGYARFLEAALREPSVVLLTAEQDARIVGYAYGRLEPRDWNALLDSSGALHDIYVEPAARRQGVARALVAAVSTALASKGARQVVLRTAARNRPAQRFFEGLGFRQTMIEMARASDASGEGESEGRG